MKLFVSIFLILSHLFSTVGFSMEIHECGREKSYSFFGFHISSACQCNHESKDHKKDCCRDKKTIVKGELKEKITAKVILTRSTTELNVAENKTTCIQKNTPCNSKSLLPHGTEYPPGYSPPLYLLYNVFLI